MYLAETGPADEEALVAQKAKALGLDPALAVQKYREIQRSMAQAPNKAEYLKATLASAKKEHKEALETLAELREKAKNVKDNAKRVKALHAIENETLRLRRVGRLLQGSDTQDLGLPFVIPIFGLIMGLVVGGVAIHAYAKSKDEVNDLIRSINNAIVTATYVTVIAGSIFGIMWLSKVASSIWTPEPKLAVAKR